MNSTSSKPHSVRCGNSKSDFFKTDTGASQGDCLSATEFTFYLAKTLENKHQKGEEHNYNKNYNYKKLSIKKKSIIFNAYTSYDQTIIILSY